MGVRAVFELSGRLSRRLACRPGQDEQRGWYRIALLVIALGSEIAYGMTVFDQFYRSRFCARERVYREVGH